MRLRTIASILLLCLCARATEQPNFLIIVADDIHSRKVGVYGEHPNPARTPVLDLLATQFGVLFRNAWAWPVCSPTRAAALTGTYPSRFGIGRGLGWYGDDPTQIELPLSATTLPELLSGYASAAIGKWHLASPVISGLAHPLLQGFGTHSGPIANIPGSQSYYSWEKSVDGVIELSENYATSENVDDALAAIEGFGDCPWLVWLAFNAPHLPYHAPPDELHTYNLPATIPGNQPIYFAAMTEAMDQEIGRLIVSMDAAVLARTWIIFIGDNGTERKAMIPLSPLDVLHEKGTVFELGVRVPLIVAHPSVAVGQEAVGVVSAADIFATVADLAGASVPPNTDSVSFAPTLANPTIETREAVYTELFDPNGFGPYSTHHKAARNVRYKLIRELLPVLRERFYDLQADPYELDNLMNGSLSPTERANYLALEAVIEGVR